MKNIESSDQKGLKEIKLKLKNKAYQMNLSTAQILNERSEMVFMVLSHKDYK